MWFGLGAVAEPMAPRAEFRGPSSERRIRIRAISAPLVLVGVLVVVAGAGFAMDAALRWDHFETNAFDLGFFDQIIYNTLHGRPGQTSFISYNFFGQHFEPILALFLLPYALGASPLFLTLTQAVIAALAAVPLHFAARRFGAAHWVAGVAAALYLANPYVHRGVNFDFHPEVMVALPAFAAAWAIAAGRGRLAMALALAPLLFKEDASFVSLALAGLMWSRGMRPEAKRVAGFAALWAVVVVAVVLPLARHGETSDLVLRYGHLVNATSQRALITGLLSHPWAPFVELLSPASLWTAALFLAVSAPCALLRPRLLWLLIPGLAIALLAQHGAQKELGLHYSANLLAAATVLSLPGFALLRGRWRFALTVPAATCVLGFFALSPYSPFEERGSTPSEAHRAALAAAIALIPGDDQVRVSAQSGILPRLSQRDNIHEFPARALDSQWVIVDRYGHVSAASRAYGYDGHLAIVRASKQLVFDQDGVQVYRGRQ